MKKRTIKITATFDMTEIPEKYITDNAYVKKMVQEEMEHIFCEDEGYEGVEVEVIDE